MEYIKTLNCQLVVITRKSGCKLAVNNQLVVVISSVRYWPIADIGGVLFIWSKYNYHAAYDSPH